MNVNDMSWAGETTPPPQRGGGRPAARFYMRPMKSEAKSIEAGRPVFEDVEFVEIFTPGDKLNVIDRPVRPVDKQNHPSLYAAFKAGNTDVDVGTPLKEWPGITRGQAEELAFFRVRTVEQLAAVSDNNAATMGPILALRQKARDYLERAAGSAPLEKVRAELASRDNEIEVMRRQLKEQADAIAELRKGKK
jgi:hypothetical protein